MKEKRLLTKRKLCSMIMIASGILFFGACAQDGYDDDESFVGTIMSGDVLAAPDASTFKVKSSSDRVTQTVSWKAVDGALDYLVSIYKNDAPFIDGIEGTAVAKDSLVHNPYVTIPRLKATYYRIVVQSAENKAEKNPASETTAEYPWDTYLIEVTVSAKEGEESVDFTKFIKHNPIAKTVEEFGTVCPVIYYFNGNIPYTMSDEVDFSGYEVTLSSENPDKKATITMGEKATFVTYSTFTLDNLKLVCDECPNPLISLSKTPDEALKGAIGKGDFYNIMSTITLKGCEATGMTGNIIFDNNKKYLLETFIIDNCQFGYDMSTNQSGNGYIYLKAGLIKDLTISNSTIWNVGDADFQYFIKYPNTRIKGVYPDTEIMSVTLDNNTMYKLASGHFANWDGLTGASKSQTEFRVRNNIFVNCGRGGGGIIRRMLKQQDPTGYKLVECAYNTYWLNGSLENSTAEIEKYDTSGNYLKSDPQLKNPEGDPADFTPSGEEQLKNKTGDPRWLPKE